MGVKQIMSEYKEAVIEDIISTMKKNSWRAVTEITEELIQQMISTKTNKEFVERMSYFLKNIK